MTIFADFSVDNIIADAIRYRNKKMFFNVLDYTSMWQGVTK